MKRREQKRNLLIAGYLLKRESGAHSIWINPKTESQKLSHDPTKSKKI